MALARWPCPTWSCRVAGGPLPTCLSLSDREMHRARCLNGQIRAGEAGRHLRASQGLVSRPAPPHTRHLHACATSTHAPPPRTRHRPAAGQPQSRAPGKPVPAAAATGATAGVGAGSCDRVSDAVCLGGVISCAPGAGRTVALPWKFWKNNHLFPSFCPSSGKSVTHWEGYEEPGVSGWLMCDRFAVPGGLPCLSLWGLLSLHGWVPLAALPRGRASLSRRIQGCRGVTCGAVGLSYWGSLGCCASTLRPPEISQVLFPLI